MVKLLVVAVLVSGCSVALQSKPSRTTVAKDCSTSHAYWIADAIGVAAGVAAISYAIATRTDDSSAAFGGVGAVGGVLYLASMGNGLKWRGECERGEPAHASNVATR